MVQWEPAAADTDVVALLLIIWDAMHNKKERARSTMDLVKSGAALFTNPMEPKVTLDKYYRVFKAQVDTIEAHGGNPGYHGAVYREHYEALTRSKGYNNKEKLDTVGNAYINKMKSEAHGSLSQLPIPDDGRWMLYAGKNIPV